jgi:hypothetical protein
VERGSDPALQWMRNVRNLLIGQRDRFNVVARRKMRTEQKRWCQGLLIADAPHAGCDGPAGPPCEASFVI